MSLTPHRAAFVEAYLNGMEMEAAYRDAYDTSRLGDAAVTRRAKDLLAHPHVATAIQAGLERRNHRVDAVDGRDVIVVHEERVSPPEKHLHAFQSDAQMTSDAFKATALDGAGDDEGGKGITLNQLNRQLEAARKLAMEKGNPSAAVSAILAKAKLNDLMPERGESRVEGTLHLVAVDTGVSGAPGSRLDA